MKRSILTLAILIIIFIFPSNNQKITTLSYLVDYEEQVRQDFLELTITVHAFSSSLQEAIAQAKEKAQKIKSIQEDICESLAKNKAQCKKSAVIGKVKIQPSYQEDKKDNIFKGIKATYEVVITVLNTQQFGDLVDKIIVLQGFVISKIEWQPDEEKIQNNFLAESLQKSKQLCKDLGLNLKRLISVEELREEPPAPQEPEPQPQEGEQEQQEEQEQEQEPQEEDDDVTTYRITVECVEKTKK